MRSSKSSRGYSKVPESEQPARDSGHVAEEEEELVDPLSRGLDDDDDAEDMAAASSSTGGSDREEKSKPGGGEKPLKSKTEPPKAQDGVFSNLSSSPQSAGNRDVVVAVSESTERTAASGDESATQQQSNQPARHTVRPITELDDSPPDEAPPSYEDARRDDPPPFFDATMLARRLFLYHPQGSPAPNASSLDGSSMPVAVDADTGEVLIDGVPVGSSLSFLWSMMLSYSFQLFGFVIAYALNASHASRCGSLAGLGLLMVRFSVLIADGVPSQYPDEDSDIPVRHRAQPMLAGILGLFGFFMVLRSLSSMIKVMRIRAQVLSESGVTTV